MRRLSFSGWPNWLKFSAVLLLAVLLPVVLLLTVAWMGLTEFTTVNAENYMRDVGNRYARVITRTFEQVQDEVGAFIDNPENMESLRGVLPLDGELGNVTPLARNQLANQLRDTLLFGGGAYEAMTLIDAAGAVLVDVRPARSVALAGNESLAGTSLYENARQAGLRGLRQSTIIVPEGRSLRIDVINVIWSDELTATGRGVAGYLIAHMNPDRVIFDELMVGESELYRTSSARLVLQDGTTLIDGGVGPVDRDWVSQAPAQAALSGQETVITFEREGQAISAYYGPVARVPMLVYVEGPVAFQTSENMTSYIITRGFPVVVGLIGLSLVLVMLLNQVVTVPLGRIGAAIRAMGRGNYNLPLPDADRGDEIGQLATEFADMRQTVAALVASLEEEVSARVRDVYATQEISHFAATQRDLNALMIQVVNLITERFPNIYHAQIFMIDDERRYDVLRASTGEPGRKLLARGHRLAVGSISVIGQVTERDQVVIARDTATSTVHKRNEILPDTMTELAIPLRASGQVIGALDVQSKQRDAFPEDQVTVLQTMADQIAMAIESARLYQESLARMEEVEREQRESTARAWRDYMNSRRTRSLRSEAGIREAEPAGLRARAIEAGAAVVGEPTAHGTLPIAVPIRLRGQVLGAVEWELPRDNFDQNKLQLAQDLTDRLAVSLDNARLFQESQRATERERLVNEITGRITAQTEIDAVLQMAVREVGQALRSPQVSIRLDPLVKPGANGHNGHNGTNGHG